MDASQVPRGSDSSTCGSRPEPITPIIGLRKTTGGGVPRCSIFGLRGRKRRKKELEEGVEGEDGGGGGRGGGEEDGKHRRRACSLLVKKLDRGISKEEEYAVRYGVS